MTILEIIEERRRYLAAADHFSTSPETMIREQCKAMDQARDKLTLVAAELLRSLPRDLTRYALKKGWIHPPPHARPDIHCLARFLEDVAVATIQGKGLRENIYLLEFSGYDFTSSLDATRKLRQLEYSWPDALRLEIEDGGGYVTVRYFAAELN